MRQVLLKNVRLDLEHVEREAGVLGVLITGLSPKVLEIVNLVRIVLRWHVDYLELFLGFGEVLEGSLRVFDPAVFDD